MARGRHRTIDRDAVDALVAQAASLRRARDADARRALRELDALLAKRARIQHELGGVLARVNERRLYLGIEGTPTFGAFVESLGLGRSQAYKLVAVARALDADTVAALGVERAYARARAERRTTRRGPVKRAR